METAQLHSLIEGIATALGAPWRCSTGPNDRRLFLDDGTTWLSLAGAGNGKLRICAWPSNLGVADHLFAYSASPYIHVSAGKGAVRIAADIRRRLLDRAEAFCRGITIKGLKWQADVEAVTSQGDRLIELSRGALTRTTNRPAVEQSFRWYSGSLYGTFRALQPDHFEITRLSGLTADEAARIVAILSERLLMGEGR